MTSNRERPTNINPMLKMSIGSVISNPISDQEYLSRTGKKNLYLTTLFIIVDILFTILIFLQEYDFLTKNSNNNFIAFFIKSLLCIVILVSIIIIFWKQNYILVKITRFVYIILGSIFYFIIFIIKIINLINELNSGDEDENEYEDNEEDINLLNIIFLFLHILTIIPRIVAFFISKRYVLKLKRIYELKMEEEHQSFVEKIASRIEKGYNRWSIPNENYIANEKDSESKQSKEYFDKKEDKDTKNYIDDNEEIEFGKENEINNNKEHNINKKEEELI